MFTDLFTHLVWADRLVWDAIGTNDDKRIRDVLAHLHMTERAFLKTWRGDHRGQINARLRELGVDPPLTDYIAWCWSGRPGVTS